jgi:hypothetical protein
LKLHNPIRFLVLLALGSAFAFGQSVQLVDPAKANLPKGQTTAAKPVPQADLLPASFANWQRQSVRKGTDPAQFDQTDAAALKEYGLTDFTTATYSAAGHILEVRAARFADAGGAFGAFTFLRQPGDQPQGVGDDAAGNGKNLIFYRGNVLVEAEAATPIADLRALAATLPQASGSARSLPALPTYLPKQPLKDVRYLTGPVSATIVKLPLTPAEVRWDDGAEVLWAQRPFASSTADLVLISYPTPQMAAARLRDLQAAMVKDQTPGMVRFARRSGPIVVWVSGAIAPAEAQSLAGAVHYDASITWNEPNPYSKRENVGGLVVGALALAGIVLLISLAAGIAFGGFRILMKRLYPDKVFDRTQDVEIIRLHLTE